MAKHTKEQFHIIYEKYARMLYGYSLRLCGDTATAEDIMQTVFLKAIEHVNSFEGNCEVSTWLCQIAKHTWYDMCRKSERKSISLESVLEKQGEGVLRQISYIERDILHELVKKEERERLYEKIHKLEEPYEEIVLLRVVGELSFREIGEVFGKAETWARVTYYRAKEKLKAMIGDD